MQFYICSLLFSSFIINLKNKKVNMIIANQLLYLISLL